MIPGIEITDGARTYTVAPMNLRIMLCEPTKALVDRIGQGPGDGPDAFQNAAIDLLLACVKRNHPEATREDLLDMINVGDLAGLLTGVMHASGMRARPLEPTPTPSP